MKRNRLLSSMRVCSCYVKMFRGSHVFRQCIYKLNALVNSVSAHRSYTRQHAKYFNFSGLVYNIKHVIGKTFYTVKLDYRRKIRGLTCNYNQTDYKSVAHNYSKHSDSKLAFRNFATTPKNKVQRYDVKQSAAFYDRERYELFTSINFKFQRSCCNCN